MQVVELWEGSSAFASPLLHFSDLYWAGNGTWALGLVERERYFHVDARVAREGCNVVTKSVVVMKTGALG